MYVLRLDVLLLRKITPLAGMEMGWDQGCVLY